MPTETRKPSMAARARGELRNELARFWRERAKEAIGVWEAPAIDGFAGFAVYLRTRMWLAAPEITDKESNLLLGRLLLRFAEYLELEDQLRNDRELWPEICDVLAIARAQREVPLSPLETPLSPTGGITGTRDSSQESPSIWTHDELGRPIR